MNQLNRISRRRPAWLPVALVWWLAACSQEVREPASDRPRNVLFISIDDLRPQLGCYGDPEAKSPHLDRLASESVLFRSAYCQFPLCTPSRTSVLTGLRPDSTRVFDMGTHFRDTVPDVVALPQLYKNHAYTSIAMGKVYHTSLDDPASWSEPPRRSKQAMRAYQDPANQELIEQLEDSAREQDLSGVGERHATHGPSIEAADVDEKRYPDGLLATRAIEALRRLKDEPFFLAVGFFKPHLPFVAPRKYFDLYQPDQLSLAANTGLAEDVPAYAVHGNNEISVYQDIPADGLDQHPGKQRELLHAYLACVSFVDAQVGRVLEELKRLELDDRTIVVVWGDHGWQLGEHGVWGKNTNFEKAAHSPLMIRVPGQRPAVTSALVEFVDIYPTLCELSGLPLPPHLEGTSLLPLFRNPTRAWKPAVFTQVSRSTGITGYSMRTDRYRLNRWIRPEDPGRTLAVELYDYERDPDERINLAGAPASAALLEGLIAQSEQGWRAALPPAP